MSAHTSLGAGGVTAPAREPEYVLRRKAARSSRKALPCRHRSPSSPATVLSHRRRCGAARPMVRNGAHVGSRSLLTAEKRKVEWQLSTNLNRSTPPLSIGHQIEAIRCLNKPTRPPVLLPRGQVLVPVARNWRAEMDGTALSPEALL